VTWASDKSVVSEWTHRKMHWKLQVQLNNFLSDRSVSVFNRPY